MDLVLKETYVKNLEFMCDQLHASISVLQGDSSPALQSLMDRVGDWSDETFGHGDRSIACLTHLIKEVGELATTILKLKDKKVLPEDVFLEFADNFMLLIDVARMQGLSAAGLLMATRIKLSINKGRRWNEPDGNGIIAHKKED